MCQRNMLAKGDPARNLFIQHVNIPVFDVCIFIEASLILGEVSESVTVNCILKKVCADLDGVS